MLHEAQMCKNVTITAQKSLNMDSVHYIPKFDHMNVQYTQNTPYFKLGAKTPWKAQRAKVPSCQVVGKKPPTF